MKGLYLSWVIVCIIEILQVFAEDKYVFNLPTVYSGPFNTYNPEGRIYVINTGSCVAHVSLRAPKLPALLDESAEIQPASSRILIIPKSLAMRDTEISSKGIELVSDIDLIVQMLIGGERFNEAFLLPKIETLGLSHIAMIYIYNFAKAMIDVTALNDITSVQLDMRGPADYTFTLLGITRKRGDVFSVSLNAYDTMQIYLNEIDATGTLITSDKPIYVITGVLNGYSGATVSSDHHYDVIRPTDQYGTFYVFSPFKHRSTGYVIQIQSFAETSSYFLKHADGSEYLTGTLYPYSSLDINVATQVVLYLTSTFPVMAAQYMKSVGGEAHENSDTAMVLLQPKSSWAADYTMVTMTTWEVDRYRTHSLSIIAAKNQSCDVTDNGEPLTSSWERIIGKNLAVTQIDMTVGTHRIGSSCGAKFTALYYGQSFKEGFVTEISETRIIECPITTVLPTTTLRATADVGTAVSTEDKLSTLTSAEATTEILSTKESLESTTIAQEPPTTYTIPPESTKVSMSTIKPPAPDSTTMLSDRDTLSNQPESTSLTTQYAQASTEAKETMKTLVNASNSKETSSSKATNLSPIPSSETFAQKTSSQTSQTSATSSSQMAISKSVTSDVNTTASDGVSFTPRWSMLEECREGTWNDWMTWSGCSVTCGVGYETRTRQCQTCLCVGNNQQHRQCVTEQDCSIRKKKTPGLVEDTNSFFGWPTLTESDRRPSACGVGGGTIAFLVVFFCLIAAMDLMSICQKSTKVNRKTP